MYLNVAGGQISPPPLPVQCVVCLGGGSGSGGGGGGGGGGNNNQTPSTLDSSPYSRYIIQLKSYLDLITLMDATCVYVTLTCGLNLLGKN